jgi:hypothetical protein
MNAARTLLLSTLALFAASTASAASYQHIDQLASRLANQMNQLTREFTEHYEHTSQYRHLMSDTVAAARLADRIHDLAHRRGCLYEMRSDLNRLDREFHHIEDLLAELNWLARNGQGGHIHGDTRHVFEMMEDAEATLHHLKDDIEALAGGDRYERFERYETPARPVYYRGGQSGGSCRSSR